MENVNREEAMEDFFDKLSTQLKNMTPDEKDDWILAQARILPEWKREDFYKSVCGSKKVIDMPERSEIDEFCEKVRNGEIAVEYETHYVEFDDFGNFHDDWEYDFYDPEQAMTFLSAVISGCHDLIVLEEYASAFEIFEEIIGLEFRIEDHPDTDDSCEDDFMDLDRAVNEGLLSLDREELLRDYVEACRHSISDCGKAAGKIAEILESELFEKCKVEECMEALQGDSLLEKIEKKLAEDLERYEKEFEENSRGDGYYWNEYRDRKRIRRIRELMEVFDGKREGTL